MEWAVWTASSDSEDAMTQEINEERSPSNRDQQDSLYGAGEQSSTKDAHGSVDLTSVKEVASTRNGWHSMDPGKAEAGKKQFNKGSQDLIHFKKKPGIKPSAPDSMGSKCTVNSSERDGTPHHEPENITKQMMSEEEDEEQDLITQEDLGESAEELESMNGVSQKLNQGRSEAQGKKRNLTEDGLGQASKLVKRLQPPQENKMPCTSSECGESASDPSCSQINESFQSKHLKGNCAAEAPVNCTESKETLSHSSELVEHQKVRTGKGKYHCPECNITCRSLKHLNRHRLINRRMFTQKPYKCPECIKCFVTADNMSDHRLTLHNVEKPYQCTECNLTFNSLVLRNKHCHTDHGMEKSVKCPQCNKRFVTADSLSQHLFRIHNVEKPFQCTECNLTFKTLFLRNMHCYTAHVTKECVKCPDCKEQFSSKCSMRKHRQMIHFH